MESLFGQGGQINASDFRDMVTNLAKYAAALQENMPVNSSSMSQSGMTDAMSDELIQKAIYTNDGKVALAQAMANPIN